MRSLHAEGAGVVWGAQDASNQAKEDRRKNEITLEEQRTLDRMRAVQSKEHIRRTHEEMRRKNEELARSRAEQARYEFERRVQV